MKVNISEAKIVLHDMVKRASMGQDIEITRYDDTLAVLVSPRKLQHYDNPKNGELDPIEVLNAKMDELKMLINSYVLQRESELTELESRLAEQTEKLRIARASI